MYLFKKLTLAALAVVFCLWIFAVTSNAQYRSRGWSNGGIYIQYGQPQWNRRRARVTPQERWRWERQRNQIYRSTNRYYRDGDLSEKERRKLAKQYYKHRRHVYRDRRDW